MKVLKCIRETEEEEEEKKKVAVENVQLERSLFKNKTKNECNSDTLFILKSVLLLLDLFSRSPRFRIVPGPSTYPYATRKRFFNVSHGRVQRREQDELKPRDRDPHGFLFLPFLITS